MSNCDKYCCPFCGETIDPDNKNADKAMKAHLLAHDDWSWPTKGKNNE